MFAVLAAMVTRAERTKRAMKPCYERLESLGSHKTPLNRHAVHTVSSLVPRPTAPPPPFCLLFFTDIPPTPNPFKLMGGERCVFFFWPLCLFFHCTSNKNKKRKKIAKKLAGLTFNECSQNHLIKRKREKESLPPFFSLFFFQAGISTPGPGNVLSRTCPDFGY